MLSLCSPAKINLFLQVISKRADGYHELVSLFQTISLHDTLEITLTTRDHFSCSHPEIPLDSSNLVLKALESFRLTTKITTPVSIHLRKRIPHQAGLGGGSSNAATTLFGLNTLFNNPLSLIELQYLGATIGSDVPFFFSEGTAYCKGRGEIVENLTALPKKNLWIVKPQEGLKTPLIFKNLKVENLPKRNPDIALNSFSTDHPHFFNDLETPAFLALPTLENLKKKLLLAGFQTVLMSGSGSAFFCIGHPHSFDPNDFIFASQAHFINRGKKMWYKCENLLQ